MNSFRKSKNFVQSFTTRKAKKALRVVYKSFLKQKIKLELSEQEFIKNFNQILSEKKQFDEFGFEIAVNNQHILPNVLTEIQRLTKKGYTDEQLQERRNPLDLVTMICSC